MRSVSGIIAIIVLSLVAAPAPAAADRPTRDTLTPATWHLTYNKGPQIQLLSSPPEVHVKLDGPSSHGGITPLAVPGNLRGHYTLEAYKPGFVFTHVRVDFVRGNGLSTAEPVSNRRSALAAALAPPGTRAWQEGEFAHGLVLSGTEASSVLGLLWSHHQQANFASLASALDEQAAVATGDQRSELEIEAAHASDRATAWRRARTEWVAVGGGLWAVTYLGRTVMAPRLDTHFDGDGHFAFSLRPIRRADAAIRSLLLPGWGQAYAGRRRASGGFLSGGLTMLIGTLLADQAYQRAATDLAYADRYLEHMRKLDPDATAIAQEQLRHAEQVADAAWSTRRLTFGLTAGFWAYNLFDAIYHARGPQAEAAGSAPAAADGPDVSALSPLGGRLGVAVRF